MLFTLPEGLIRTRTEMHGEQGRAWLAELPAIVEDCVRRWSLTLEPPFPNLSYNYAAPACQVDGTACVLKVCYPDKEVQPEAEALAIFDGRGAERLLAYDDARSAMLLERVLPGTPLSTLAIEQDEHATSILASVLRQLWRPVPERHALPSVADWARGLSKLRQHFDGGTGPLPANLVARAEGLFAELLASQTSLAVLHGDAHHDNILASSRGGWLAIDPKGIIGEPTYDTAAMLYNPLETLPTHPDARRLLARRVDQLSEELDLDRERVIGWGLAQAVLSAWWFVDDDMDGWQAPIAVGTYLAEL